MVITSLGPNEKGSEIDITVTSPFSVKRDAIVSLVAAKAMEARKRKKYVEECRNANLIFCPFAIESYGATTDVATNYILDPLSRESRLQAHQLDRQDSQVFLVPKVVTHPVGFKCQKGEALPK